ncbi:MAG: SDR family NAD(P)-dependent oxidoreductase [Acidimicrobiia bacterium]|nr:SDR family NAD(P)-dependent oxidoreductase [Acidimicrobiia bacterium]
MEQFVNPGRFDGRAAVVTGAAGGIGRATAQRLAAEGARVLCVDLDGDGATDTARAVRDDGGTAESTSCDVTDPAAATAAIGTAVDAFGGLDVLCNIAGIGFAVHTHDETDDGWRRTLDVNLSGTFYMCRAAVPHLLDREGVIVNTASTAGLMGQAYMAAYCASKHGVVGLTKALAIEYGRKGLRANAVCPGGTDTGILSGFAPPEDANLKLMMRAMLLDGAHPPEGIAALFAYVASPEATYVNGAAIAIDGGTTAG